MVVPTSRHFRKVKNDWASSFVSLLKIQIIVLIVELKMKNMTENCKIRNQQNTFFYLLLLKCLKILIYFECLFPFKEASRI